MPLDLAGLTSPDGEYELVDKLGEGNYGAVYKGNQIKGGKVVAIKVIEYDEEDHDDIALEIDVLLTCRHTNIVGYFGTYLKFGKIWMVMEMCQGGSLIDIYTVTKGMREEHISFVCMEMLKGLQYLHENGIIHRDIKGGNVLLTVAGEVKLADFGVSAITSSESRRRNTFIGTPYWMSPEIIACEKDELASYDDRCDIWALGITAIEMVEMNPPLSDFHPLRALYLIPANPSPTLKNEKKFSKEFNDFIRICLTKDPAERPSASALLKHKFVQPDFTAKKTLRKRQNTLVDVIEKAARANKGEYTFAEATEDLPSPVQHTAKKTLFVSSSEKSSNVLASLMDSLIGSKPSPSYLIHKEEKLYGVPFRDVEEDDHPAAVMHSGDIDPLGFDDENFTGAVISNPMFGFDSDEEPQARQDESEEDESEISSTSLKKGLNLIDDIKSDSDSPRVSTDQGESEFDPDTPTTQKAGREEESSRAKEDPKVAEREDSGTKFLAHLPVRQNSLATKVTEIQQEALSKKRSSVTLTKLEEEGEQEAKEPVKVYLAKKDFPIEIVCADMFLGKRYIFGTPTGLYQLDKQGNLLRLIGNVNFHEITVLTEFGVMMALCTVKASTHIRMYSLSLMSRAAQKQKAPALFPFLKLNGSKACTHYSIARCGKNVYLLACSKKEVTLFMWASFPQNQFMKIKTYELPDRVVRVEAIGIDTVTEIVAQCTSRFCTINTETSAITILMESYVGKSVPFSLAIRGSQIFLAFHNFACFLDSETHEMIGDKMVWRTPPLSVVPLSSQKVVCFGQRQSDVFESRRGQPIQSLREIEGKKIRFLLTQFDGRDLVISARTSLDGASTPSSSVFIVRNNVRGRGGTAPPPPS